MGIKRIPFNADELSDVAKRLRSVCDSLESVAVKMSGQKIRTLSLGPKSAIDSLEQWTHLASAAHAQLDRHRIQSQQ